MLTKKKIVISLILNIIIFVFTVGIVVSYFFWSSGATDVTGPERFMYFTTDSNILSAIAALIMAFFEIQILKGKVKTLPHFAVIFKYVATVSVMVTFFTVMLFLGPIYTYKFVLSDTAFYMHLVEPLSAFISLCVFETASPISMKEMLLGLLPTVIYGIVYVVEVILISAENGGWYDFYSFNIGGYWYVTVFVMILATFLICLLTRYVHNKVYKIASKKHN